MKEETKAYEASNLLNKSRGENSTTTFQTGNGSGAEVLEGQRTGGISTKRTTQENTSKQIVQIDKSMGTQTIQ